MVAKTHPDIVAVILVLITSDKADEWMSLRDAADRLGVHYMTAYRYVRLGQLPSTQENGRWMRAPVGCRRPPPRSAGRRNPVEVGGRRRPAVLRGRLLSCLLAGDESSAWNVVERALTTGYTAVTSTSSSSARAFAPSATGGSGASCRWATSTR